jgi:DNA-binding transcriptional MerR regulator
MSTTTGYRIAEVARRSGFTSATLRYYEDIGLMPAAARTDAGYRTYDDRDLERLTFIARAKQLGCTLEETSGLMAAWDSDCGDVQQQLRGLVADKIVSAQHQVTALVAFTAQLQHTAAALAGDPLDGPCGDDCACLADSQPESTRDDLGPKPAQPDVESEPPIVCTLAPDQMGDRISQWRAVLDEVVSREQIEGGIRLNFASGEGLAAAVADLAEREHGCCSFFDFDVRIGRGGLALVVRAPDAAAGLVAAVFGTAL